MSRWRRILLASSPSLSACQKPTAENKHDPSPTDNEIKNGNIISCAGLLWAYALRSRTQRGTKASPLRNSHWRECDIFLAFRAFGHRKPVELFLAHHAEILLARCRRFVAARMAIDERAIAGVS